MSKVRFIDKKYLIEFLSTNTNKCFKILTKRVILIKKQSLKMQMRVKDNLVSVIRIENVDYISLTDLARYKNPTEPKDVIKNWIKVW